MYVWMQIIGWYWSGNRRAKGWMHNGGLVPIVSDGQPRLPGTRVWDFLLLNKIMIIMEQTSLDASTLPLSLWSFYLAYTIFPSQNKRSKKNKFKIVKEKIYIIKQIQCKFNQIYTIQFIKVKKGKSMACRYKRLFFKLISWWNTNIKVRVS